MELLIDAGNSRLKWAVYERGQLCAFDQCPYARLSEYVERQWRRLERPSRVVIACVASEERACAVRELVWRVWQLEVTTVTVSAASSGVRNGYTQPSQLGVDRWAAMVGAFANVVAPLCIVDCGTAVTVDALTAEGQHLGGYIVPGVTLQQQSVEARTAAVRTVATEESEGWGRTTQQGIRRGVLLGVAALVERSVAQLQREQQGEVRLVLTGGDAEALIPLLEIECHYDALLVLRGIARMIDMGEV